ncbi:MAG: hypothetical protein LBF70_01605, partial [Holosporales bacterium]|jgi:DNA replication and repair protein RecF|nr:hypothetical protein [Holosporales bacterium]
MFTAVRVSSHIKNIKEYEKLTRERLKILKNYGQRNDFDKWLSIIEMKIASLGIDIGKERIKMTKTLANTQLNCDFPEFQNKMTGGLENDILIKDPESQLEVYKAVLYERREKDGMIGSTSFGPNRSDWKVFHVNKQIEAQLCSAGEQKMLLSGVFLSFVISNMMRDKRNLILLIDDVIAHLDSDHRNLFLRYIKKLIMNNANKINIWLSGTSKKLFDELKDIAKFFVIRNNTVNEE